MTANLHVGPPRRVVYLLRDPSRAVASVLAAASGAEGPGGGLVGHCALAGCLLPLALEHLASKEFRNARDASSQDRLHGINNYTATMIHNGCSEEDRRLALYAAGGVEFFLLRHHFDQWAAAARSGLFEV